jgi:hypothetical protein
MTKKLTNNTTVNLAHAHCCSKFIMRHKTTVAIDLEFIAKGKNALRESRKLKKNSCVSGEFFVPIDTKIMKPLMHRFLILLVIVN